MSMLAGPEAGRRHIPHASHRETEDLGKGGNMTTACSSYVHLHS